MNACEQLNVNNASDLCRRYSLLSDAYAGKKLTDASLVLFLADHLI